MFENLLILWQYDSYSKSRRSELSKHCENSYIIEIRDKSKCDLNYKSLVCTTALQSKKHLVAFNGLNQNGTEDFIFEMGNNYVG